MSDYLVFQEQLLIDSGAPATHAIVIGVGQYPHLNGGDPNQLTDLNGGLGQLSSPPASAREITGWLLDQFHNPDKPLASISLLTSEGGGPQPFTHNRLAQPFTPKTATIDHVKKAVDGWKNLGDLNEQNLVLFFFCGHGIARGLDGLTLMLSDYGASNNMPMDGAVDFAALHRGMSQCAASYQCYFVDACRTVSDIAVATTATGQMIIQDNIARPWASDWNFAVIYSTLAGEKAYGRKNKPSFYTEELIRSLNGAGSNNRSGDGRWRVSTGDLIIAMNYGLSQRGEKIKVPMSALVQFEFHELRGEPEVPVMVYCDSEADTNQAEFACLRDGDVAFSRPPDDGKWTTEVPHGTYDFIAKLDRKKGRRDNESILPPYRDIEIKLEADG